MTILSLQNTMTAKEGGGMGDKSLCSLHAVPLDSSKGRDGEGLIRFYR